MKRSFRALVAGPLLLLAFGAGGALGADVQSADQSASSSQSAGATAAATQYASSNTNVAVRIGSPGDNGSVTQSNSSAALAGASALREVDEADPELVKERAVEMLERMQKSQGFDALEDQIIELGTWDHHAHTFTATDPTTTKPFAVRVVSIRNNTPLFFAAILGKHFTNVSRAAVALGSGTCSGIWGLEGVRVIGDVVTDSYDSSAGTYASQATNTDGDGNSYANENGDMETLDSLGPRIYKERTGGAS